MGEEVTSRQAARCSGSPHPAAAPPAPHCTPSCSPHAAPPAHAQLCQAAAPQLLAQMSIKPREIVLPAKELFIFLCTQMAGKILAELSKKERVIQCIFPL